MPTLFSSERTKYRGLVSFEYGFFDYHAVAFEVVLFPRVEEVRYKPRTLYACSTVC